MTPREETGEGYSQGADLKNPEIPGMDGRSSLWSPSSEF
jgi:hypothetical protein